jgi:hypothetical protein
MSWLEWFKHWVANHDLLHSNNVLATTTKEFVYQFREIDTEIEFDCYFLFMFKADLNDPDRKYKRVVRVPYMKYRYSKDEDEFLVQDRILHLLTKYIVYGKDFMNVAKILTGDATLNWQDPVEEQKTLKDIIDEEIRPKDS